MTLSRKTILLIISTTIALLFILAASSNLILLDSFAKLEKEVLQESVQKITNELTENFELLSSAGSYFVELGEHGRLKGADVPLPDYRTDLVAWFDFSGRPLSGRIEHQQSLTALKPKPGEVAALQQAVRYIAANAAGDISCFVAVGDQVLQLVAHRFAQGFLVVGKRLDRAEVHRISSLYKMTVDLATVTGEDVPQESYRAYAALVGGASFYDEVYPQEQLIAGYVLKRDLYGNPALLVKVTEKRVLFQQGKTSISYLLLALFVTGFVFCIVILIFIRRVVLKRMAALRDDARIIAASHDRAARLTVSSDHDELDDLALSINTMLDALDASRKALQESEERYRTLFTRAPDSILIIGVEGDEAGRIVDANRAAANLHGYTLVELCSMGIQDLNAPETNALAPSMTERIRNGEWITEEVWHCRKDGSTFPLEIHAGLVKIQGRDYILGFDRDITQRKLVEKTDRMYLEQISLLNNELACKAKELALANQELAAFNYSVSHDMRGPLTRVSGYCQLMLDECDISAEAREYLTRIYDSSCWMDEMIDAMLKLTTIARSELVPTQVNLSLLAEDMLHEITLAEPERPVELKIQPEIMVEGDPGLLKIALANLLGNAWKYTMGRSPAQIELGSIEKSGRTTYFVSDNGAGFDMSRVDKLFQPFARLHSATQFTGSGIGLATVQRIISRHGGKVWAEAEPGKGATFFFTLGTPAPLS